MKHLAVVIIALTISGTTIAHAGGLSDPVIEQEIIIEAAKAGSSSSGTAIVALMGVLLFAAALSN